MINRILAALALVLALVAPARATSYTTQYAPTQAAYVDLGAGPLQVSLNTTWGVYLIVADAQPSASALGEPLDLSQPSSQPRVFNTTSHVWARAIQSNGATIQVTSGLAPGLKVGSGSFASPAPITVTSSATLLVAARAGPAGVGRVAVTITCAGIVAIGMTSGVTFAGAGQIPAGGALTLETMSAIYGIVGSGSTTCNAWETF
jgi:hypothetical protein